MTQHTRQFSHAVASLVAGGMVYLISAPLDRWTRASQSKREGVPDGDEAAMAMEATIKVCDPVSVPVSVLAELHDLRALVLRLRQEAEGLRQEAGRLRQDNERLQRELQEALSGLDKAKRQSKRQAAPFSKGAPKPQPKTPGRKAGSAHGRHGHRLPPPPATVDVVLEAPLPDSCPHCGAVVQPTVIHQQYQTEIPRRPIIRQFNIHVGCCRGCGRT